MANEVRFCERMESSDMVCRGDMGAASDYAFVALNL
jgi:hypothetical protein